MDVSSMQMPCEGPPGPPMFRSPNWPIFSLKVARGLRTAGVLPWQGRRWSRCILVIVLVLRPRNNGANEEIEDDDGGR